MQEGPDGTGEGLRILVIWGLGWTAKGLKAGKREDDGMVAGRSGDGAGLVESCRLRGT